jgi:hypothetical protein
MSAEVGVLEHVLGAAVTACCLHGGLKVALAGAVRLAKSNGGVEMVIVGRAAGGDRVVR